jgi:FMN phosphatase YigB (HAD superfamily)
VSDIKAVIFDFHDTLAYLSPSFSEILALESETALEAASAAIVQLEPQIDELRKSELWLRDENGVGWDWWYAEFCGLSGSRVAPKELRHNVANRLANPASYVLCPQVDRALNALQRLRLRLGCVSNTVLDLERALRRLQIAGYFDYVATSETLGVSKPNRAFFQSIATQLDLTMSEILFVGDKAEEDAAAATRSAMVGAWLAPDAEHLGIAEEGYYIIRDLSSIADVIAAVES